ncbi:MAG: TIGR01777 family oxidoreductase [candidate division Zixibacteria bacterium]
MSGSSGLIGRALTRVLNSEGDEICRLVRIDSDSPYDIPYDWHARTLDNNAFNGIDTVIHLAGENIGKGRWTKSRKRKIYDSRILSTKLIAETLAKSKKPPSLLICASAVGYYGSRPDKWVDENSPAGTGFLADLVSDWEAAAQPAIDAGTRTVFLRLGIVLSKQGGAFPKMALPFRFGLGGRIGSGQQQMSWVMSEDVIAAIQTVMSNSSIVGALNVVSPNPITNSEFTKLLAEYIGIPAWINLPSSVLKLLFGREMAEELFLSSSFVKPAKLTDAGFAFRCPDFKLALKKLLPRH